MSRPLLSLVAALGVSLVASSAAFAAEIEKVEFAEFQRVKGYELQLHNVGLVRYRIVIKAMVAALYLEKETSAQHVLNDVAKRLEIEYFWELKGSDIVKAANDLLARNLPATTLNELRPQFDQMNRLFEDIKPGDRYALTYIPGEGTELSLNGKRKGIVPGKEFAAAYYTIWLGRKPMDPALRDQLVKPR